MCICACLCVRERERMCLCMYVRVCVCMCGVCVERGGVGVPHPTPALRHPDGLRSSAPRAKYVCVPVCACVSCVVYVVCGGSEIFGGGFEI